MENNVRNLQKLNMNYHMTQFLIIYTKDSKAGQFWRVVFWEEVVFSYREQISH
jgi:hypothetical protein